MYYILFQNIQSPKAVSRFFMHFKQLKSSDDPSSLIAKKHLVSAWSGCYPTVKCFNPFNFYSFLSWYYNNETSIEWYGSFNGTLFYELAKIVLKIFFN